MRKESRSLIQCRVREDFLPYFSPFPRDFSAMTFRPLLPAAACAVLVLTGCSALQTLMGPGAIDPKDTTAKKALVLYGTGVQKFQCTADTKGLWWRFITPEVTLRDEKGRKVASQGADFTFSAPDKSRLAAKVESWTEGKTKHDLKGLLFAVRPAGNLEGVLSPYRWVKRDDAKGGIPASACTRNSLGAVLAVRFTARYTFYR